MIIDIQRMRSDLHRFYLKRSFKITQLISIGIISQQSACDRLLLVRPPPSDCPALRPFPPANDLPPKEHTPRQHGFSSRPEFSGERCCFVLLPRAGCAQTRSKGLACSCIVHFAVSACPLLARPFVYNYSSLLYSTTRVVAYYKLV